MASTPDVIIGNKIGSVVDFIMAVVFIDNSGNVDIDYFDINFPGAMPGAFTVTYNSSQTLYTAPPSIICYTVHVDVVAQSSALTSISLPLCDKFFVTWDVETATVHSSYGSLSAYDALLSGPVNFICSDGWKPDVAGIERSVGGSPHLIGCLSFIETCYEYLYYQEWDVTASTISSCSIIGTVSPLSCAPGFDHPRIDANDDYATNGSGCQYKVACEYVDPATGYAEVNTYDATGSAGVIPTSSYIDLSPLPPLLTYPAPTLSSPYFHYCPTVAFGANNSSEYMISECTNIPGGFGDFFMMEPLDNSCSGGIAPDPSSTPSYFEVAKPYSVTSINHANSISTPCNNVGDTSLMAWAITGAGGRINYKRAVYDGSSSTGFNYRSSKPTNITTLPQSLSIYPNPATNSLTVNNPASIGADRYTIKNVLGQIVLDGRMNTGTQSVDIGTLTGGSYIISLYHEGSPCGNKVFVKN